MAFIRLFEKNLVPYIQVNAKIKYHDHIHENECRAHSHEHECNVDQNIHLCGQCGKLHSKYFIENHYCVCQTLFNIIQKYFEEFISNNFLCRAPPTSNFI